MSLITAVTEAKPSVSCLVMGDSIALQLAPRLAKLLKDDGRERIGFDARRGESAWNFLRRGWWREAIARYAPCPIVACLGVNCVKSQRATLAETYEALYELAGGPSRVLWIAPNIEGFAHDLGYMRSALLTANCDVLWLPKLALESDRVHPTDASHRKIAELVVRRIWPM